MPKKPFPDPARQFSEASSAVLRRAVMAGIVIAVLAGVAGLTGYLTRSEAPAPSSASGARSAAPTPHTTSRPASGEPVAAPPRTGDPVTFAKAATKALWTYDAGRFSRAEHLAGLKRWLTGEEQYRDWESVSGQVPGTALWSRLHDNRQRATATVGEGHFPQAFKTAMSEDPGGITQAYVYAVTVTGKQALAWKDGGSGAESRQVTLAVQCRPHRSCALSGVLPEVAP